MKIIQRIYGGESDIQAMIALVRVFQKDSLHVMDLPYRFSSWAFDDPANISIWTGEKGDVLAWAILQAPFWAIDYVCHPEVSQDLHPQILSWADHRAREVQSTPFGRPVWYINIFASKRERRREIEKAGFESQADKGDDSWSKVWMQHAGYKTIEERASPPGFQIRPLAGQNEVEAYVELHRAVFESKNMTREWRSRILQQPAYRAELDLVVIAPKGRLAAFCIGWLGTDTEGKRIGQVEPMGVHQDFRALGVGSAILTEGIKRLYQCGADRVYVETDMHRNAALSLYKRVGFSAIEDVIVYGKEYVSAEG